MAGSFLALPIELRLQIYRELLRHPKTIDLYDKAPADEEPTLILNRHQWDRPVHLATRLLATCRQIHDEAVEVLYRENNFFIRRSDIRRACPTSRTPFPLCRLAMLKELSLSVLQSINDIGEIQPEWIAGVLGWLATTGCSLERLSLRFSFYTRQENPYDELDAWCFEATGNHLWPIKRTLAGKYVEDHSIAAAIAKLDVSKQIVVGISDDSYVDSEVQPFQQFSEAIAAQKDWFCRTMQDEHQINETTESIIVHKYLWHLSPVEDEVTSKVE